MTRPKITVLCEDKQHDRQIYAVLRPKTSAGAGEQFVRDHYPAYLDAIRKRSGVLVVMIDSDHYSRAQRLKQMDVACHQKGVLPRTRGDKVALFIPQRNIETWLALRTRIPALNGSENAGSMLTRLSRCV